MSDSHPLAAHPASANTSLLHIPGGVDFERFLTVSPDMFAIFNAEGEALSANASWFETLGYPPERVLGGTLLWLVHEDDRESLTEAFLAIVNTPNEQHAPTRARFRDSAGRYRWFDWSGVMDDRTRLVYTIARDISPQIEAAEMREQLLADFQKHTLLLEEQAAAMDVLRKQAERLARFDSLTGVLNRGAWFDEVQRATPLSLAIVDIDHFKRINDTFGHPAGDAVLREVAQRVSEATGIDGNVGRTGGEEFAIMFCVPFEDATAVCQRILAAVSGTPFNVTPENAVWLSVSVGLSPWHAVRGAEAGALARTYEEADRALYRAKAFGRNQLALPVVHQAA
ncbi:MAG TPA: sensor domain-containing diguanylate cyclase [Tepidiformaceae bacterium]|nr:sensor domain-containing diguanylate cyclase [Tepidiformaceae bacterium]